MDVVWDGITRFETLNDVDANVRRKLADAAKAYDWPTMLALLAEHPQFVNASRPGGASLYSPLHQAAHGGAPSSVVQQLLDFGAWRTLLNARGERPCDIAERQGQKDLAALLEPQLKHHVPIGVLRCIQQHFHAVIRGRAERLIEEQGLRLPDLEPLLELERPEMWFSIPGMYGGFSYRLEDVGVSARLVSESWCRVAGGSGQRHEVTSVGSRLVAEGFV